MHIPAKNSLVCVYDLVSTREQLRILLFWKLLQKNNAMPLRVNYTHAATCFYYQNL